MNYFCVSCEDIRTFWSSPKLTCIFVSKNLISVDCVLTCGCGSSIPAWFLIESKNDITGQAPAIRILKKSVKLSDMVRINDNRYGEFTPLLDNAMHVLKFDCYATRRYVEFYLNSIDLSPYISGGAQPKLNQKNLNSIPIPLPSIREQERIVGILDRFDALCNDLTFGLPAEIEARTKQYEYYRDKLLTFKEQ